MPLLLLLDQIIDTIKNGNGQTRVPENIIYKSIESKRIALS